MRRQDQRWLGVCALLCACGGAGSGTADEGTSTDTGGGTTTGPTTTSADDSTSAELQFSFTLSDGTLVVVRGNGQLLVSRDGRDVFTMADDARPTVRTFTESYAGGVGIWSFGREGETARVTDTLVSAEQVGDTVVVAYADAEATASVTAEISVDVPGQTTRILWTPGGTFDSVAIPLACDDEATFYGFGEQYNATDQRGEAFELLSSEQGIGRDPAVNKLPLNGDAHTTYFPMPYWLDARGFGGLLTTPYRVDVDLCATDPGAAWLEAGSGDPLEAIVFGGPTVPEVLRQLGDRLGRPALPPDWAWTLWIGAQGGQQDVLDEVDALQAASIPVGVMWVQDWTGIRPNLDGGSGVEYRWLPDTTLYPDLAAMTADLHGRGLRFLGYANPFIDTTLEHHPQMEADGLLITNASGDTYDFVAPNGLSSLPDFTNPAAGDYVRQYLSYMVTGYGMDGWMADFGEWLPLDATLADGSDAWAEHNLYPVRWHETSRQVMDEVRPDGDWVVFARSGYTGVHANAQVYWVGDQEATFSPYDGLPTVVPAMINLGLAGIPFVTHDIAGFSGGPSTKELFARWTELGAFTPIMRTHEGANKDDNWSWDSDAETTEHFRRFALVHDALTPEIMAWAAEAAQTSMPIVRHLMLEFPDDADARTVSDQYMLGDALLVAPVTTQGATSRMVYLPAGTPWFHVWTGDEYAGGQTVEIAAPIGSPPVFSRGADRSDLRAIE